MADYHSESPEVIAKEITLAVIDKVPRPGDPTAEHVGERYGKLYKVILKHIREGIHEEKYE